VRVNHGSPLAGRTIEELRLHDTSGANLVAIQRDGWLIQPTGKTELRAGDVLLIDLYTDKAAAEVMRQTYSLQPLPLTGAYFTDRSQEIGMAEVIVPASSELVGQTVAGTKFRQRTGLSVIGLRRGATAHERELQNEKLKLGDTLLLVGPWQALRNVQAGGKDLVLLNLPAEHLDVLPAAGKARQAVFCLALVVGLMVSGLVPNVQAALIGCLLMGVLGCVDLNSAYRSIDWKTIVLIVGMLPFSVALQRTGGVDMASEALMDLTSGAGTYAVLGAVFAITAILGMFISNTATAVLMAPVSLAIAEDLHASPYPFAMIVALAASTAFMTPVSSPVNTLVVSPGNYSFGDFVRIGVPFAAIVMMVSVLLVPLLLPLY
jgi:di/tricarboxylate transporter